MTVELFGIRHHGPGSARSLHTALDEWRPDAVLVELPADCQAALDWVGDPALRPPVALLGWVLDEPRRAAFAPFAGFSPEWVAFTWARRNGASLRAIDLPLANVLAGDAAADDSLFAAGPGRPIDPLAALAAAAGDPDPERWWEDVIEHRGDGPPAFAAVAAAMAAARSGAPPPSVAEERREAHMRQAIRRAANDGHERIAVVCGAWHVPALAPTGPAANDARTLRGLTKVKVGVSWVPWTHHRLAAAGADGAPGYAAGVRSPGWYAHVYAHPGEAGVARWFVDAARLLRRHDLPASPDHLIAATRAAEALAALRGRPRPGLDEVLDAAQTVLAATGSGMSLIRDELIVGAVIGTVPDDAPQVPLARDLAVQQRRARLKPEAGSRTVELDVRAAAGRAKSVLLHRLTALGVEWGVLVEGRGSSGTFRETWTLSWEPELTIRVIELAGHGTTVESAASSRLLERAATTTALAELVAVLDLALLADLAAVITPVVARLAAEAAHDPDIAQVIDTLVPLATALRYGDVRATDVSALRGVFDGLVVRVLAGVLGACRSLDDDAAAVMVERLAAVQAALALTDHAARADGWPNVLERLTGRGDVHGLIRGRAARLLHDGGTWDRDVVERRLSRALSFGTPAPQGAAFVEGFLAGSGTVLVHDAELLGVIDTWVSSLAPDAFGTAAPLLRRTFGGFEPAERRQLGQLLADGARVAEPLVDDDLDPARAAAAMATVRSLLGVVS